MEVISSESVRMLETELSNALMIVQKHLHLRVVRMETATFICFEASKPMIGCIESIVLAMENGDINTGYLETYAF